MDCWGWEVDKDAPKEFVAGFSSCRDDPKVPPEAGVCEVEGALQHVPSITRELISTKGQEPYESEFA